MKMKVLPDTMKIFANDLGVKAFPKKEDKDTFLTALDCIENDDAVSEARKGIAVCDICNKRMSDTIFSCELGDTTFIWDATLFHAVDDHDVKPPNIFIDAVLSYNPVLRAMKKILKGQKIPKTLTKEWFDTFFFEDWCNMRKGPGAEQIKKAYKALRSNS